MYFNNKDWWLSILDFILKRPNVANGFIYEDKKEEDREVELGAEHKVYNESGNWLKYRSTGERQRRDNSSETMACATYGTHNAGEDKMNLMKVKTEEGHADYETMELVRIFKHFGLYDELGEANLSDRFTAKSSNTSFRGNTFNNVFNSIRHDGVVAESVWPTPERYSWSEYYAPIPQEVIARGKKFTEYVEFVYERVMPHLANKIKTHSPCIGSVYADGDWNNPAVEIKPKPRQRHNHAICNDYYENGKFDGIYDSYKPFTKKVAWNYGIGSLKIIDFKLKKRLEDFNTTAINEINKKFVMRTEVEAGGHGEIYRVDNGKLVPLTTKEKLDEFVITVAQKGELIGITEKYYKELTNTL